MPRPLPLRSRKAANCEQRLVIMAHVSVSPFGHLPDGRPVERYTLASARGVTAEIMTYGATLLALRTPDRDGCIERITLGFDALEPYLAGTPYFGATVGRYANRIAGARFVLDGQEYVLSANEGRNQLHGGVRGFDKALWSADPSHDGAEASVLFSYRSADGEEGYPGALSVDVAYRLAEDRLAIDYRATTTAPTHVNLTHHSYFNLSGDALAEIAGHDLTINADLYTPIGQDLIPTGALRDVGGGPFDFRTPRTIGARIDANDEQLRFAGGYDHNFVLNKPGPNALTRAARLRDFESGRALEVWTTEPGLQVYSGNFLDGSLIGPTGCFARRTGLCLEPQHFPNSPNEPRFPSTVLRPAEKYRSRTEFRLCTPA
jgi:aldose 1-epimerase